jgi:hypothetical protein
LVRNHPNRSLSLKIWMILSDFSVFDFGNFNCRQAGIIIDVHHGNFNCRQAGIIIDVHQMGIR